MTSPEPGHPVTCVRRAYRVRAPTLSTQAGIVAPATPSPHQDMDRGPPWQVGSLRFMIAASNSIRMAETGDGVGEWSHSGPTVGQLLRQLSDPVVQDLAREVLCGMLLLVGVGLGSGPRALRSVFDYSQLHRSEHGPVDADRVVTALQCSIGVLDWTAAAPGSPLRGSASNLGCSISLYRHLRVGGWVGGWVGGMG